MKTAAPYFRKGCVKYLRYLLSVSFLIPMVGPANNVSVALEIPQNAFDLDAFLSDFTLHINSTIIAPSQSTSSNGVETVTSTRPTITFARQGPSDEASSQWHGTFHEDVSNESESNFTFLIGRANDNKVKAGGRDFSEYNEKWRQYALLAREEAKCLHEFGSFQPRTDLALESESFGPTICVPGLPNFDDCDICVNLTASVPTQGDCQNSCGSKATCMARCLSMVQSISVDLKTFTSSKKAEEGPHDLDESLVASDALRKYRESHLQLLPEVFCEGVVLPQSFSFPSGSNKMSQPGRHFVYIKIQLKEMLKNYVNTSLPYTHNDTCHNCNMEAHNKSNSLGPLVFLFQQRHLLNYSNLTGNESSKPTWSNWITLGKTPYGFDEIQVTYSQRTYQWKVTTVSLSGIIAAATLPPFTTLNGYVEPGPPTRVSIVDTKVDADDNVNVLIAWEPPPERACFYKIVLESQMGDERPRTVRIKDVPLGVHQIWFKNLRFDKPYGVRITSRGAGWHGDESTQATLYFTTPSCLLVHNYNFDKCPPTPPSNMTYTVEHMTAEQIELLVSPPSNRKNGLFTVHVSWKPPLYATDDNPVREYIVDVAVLGLGLDAVEKNFTEMLFAPFTIAGNITETRLDGLRGNVEYTILISAKSDKGSSVPAKLTVKIDGLDVHIPEHQHDWIYPSTAFVAVVLMVFACQIGRNIFHKWKIKVARDSYFKSIEERDAMEHEWSILPMNEQYSAWKILDENLPGKKWNIGFQNLIMGDIIGQGAFGIVRRAKIKRSKYLELWQKQRQTQPSVPETCGDEGEQYETVAVKMLKVSCTSTDRDDLIKEIVTMQSLGSHPNIVSLLGACTTGRLICLVMEYCPGGDLLSFLRKVREKFLPLLNVTCMSRRSSSCTTWSPTTSERSDLTRSEKETEEAISEGSPTVECKPSEGNIALEDSRSDDTQHEAPIDEGDVLSYARQVALGMAYLERNHVIHRDLACRNILVMGDYKVVKISDFGLSRDIYTWNVYHQKSDGKLPFKWMALESISSHLFTSKSDVWSYGILLWELVTLGGNPYPALGNQELYNMLKSGYRMERPENCSEELYAIMRKCWRSAPSDRPNFMELIRHLEAMIDTSEPKAYLSLQPDVAKDRFSSSTRSDLPEVTDHLLPYISLANSAGMIGGPSVLPRQNLSRKSTIQTLQDDRHPQYYNLKRQDELSEWHSDPEDDIIVQSGLLPTSNEASTWSSYVQQEKRRNTFPLFRTRIAKSQQPPSRKKFFRSKNLLTHVFPRLLKTSQSSVSMSLKKSKLARHRHKRQWQFKKPKKTVLGDTNTNFVEKGANFRTIRCIRGNGNQKMAINCIYGLKLQETIN